MIIDISNLMDVIEDNSIFQKAKTPLSAKKIKRRTIRALTAPNTLVKPLFLRYVIPAVLVSVLSITALAVGIYACVGDWFQSLFLNRTHNALTAEQVSFIADHAKELHATDSVNGYTVSLDGILHDGKTSYIKLSVSSPTEAYAKYYSYGFESLPVLHLGTKSVGCSLMEWSGSTGSPDTDSQFLLVAYWDSIDDFKEILDDTELITLELTDLYRYNASVRPVERILVAEGTWNFEIPAESFQITGWNQELIKEPLECKVAKAMCGDVIKIKITSFNLQAMSATMTYEYPSKTSLESIKIDKLKIVLNDGTIVQAYPSGGEIIKSENGYVGEIIFGMAAPLSLNECSHVIFPNGETITIH